jgi:hypothetical protein
MGVTREVMKLDAEGKTPYQIRSAVDQKYIQYIQDATPDALPAKGVMPDARPGGRC